MYHAGLCNCKKFLLFCVSGKTLYGFVCVEALCNLISLILYFPFVRIALYAFGRRGTSTVIRSDPKDVGIRTISESNTERRVGTSFLWRVAHASETAGSSGSWRFSTKSWTITLSLTMKLGKGPTSVLDRHPTVNDATALRRCFHTFQSHKTVSLRQ